MFWLSGMPSIVVVTLTLWVLGAIHTTLAFTIPTQTKTPTTHPGRRQGYAYGSGIHTDARRGGMLLNVNVNAESEGRGKGSNANANANAKLICSFDETDFSGRTSWPYTATDLNRLDNSDDAKFYEEARLVTHIDDVAIQSLSEFYKESFEKMVNGNDTNDEEETTPQKTIDVLDLCSSWISHLPEDDADCNSDSDSNGNGNTWITSSSFRYGTVMGLGMNQQELDENPQLTDTLVQDLNLNPKLSSLSDESFDVVTMAVSIDYLVRPLEVVQEIHRVLKPNGNALISFGDRCFPTKAVAMWLQADPIERITLVASYFHYAQYDQDQDQDQDDTPTTGTDSNERSSPLPSLFRWKSIECFDLKGDPLDMPTKPSVGELMSDPARAMAWMTAAAAVQKTNRSDPLFVIKATK